MGENNLADLPGSARQTTRSEVSRKLTSVENLVNMQSSRMTNDLAEMRQLQCAVAENQAKIEEARERRITQANEADSKARSSLLNLQVQEAESRAKRQKLLNKLVAALVFVVTSSSASGVYYVATGANMDEVTSQEVEAKKALTKALDRRVDKVEKRTVVLKDMALEQQVQISEDGEYTRDLIRAAHPRMNEDQIDIPESVPKAKKKSEAIKRAKKEARKEMFDEKSVDPFAGI